MRILGWVIGLVILAGALALVAHRQGWTVLPAAWGSLAAPPPAPGHSADTKPPARAETRPPVPVHTAKVEERDLPAFLSAVGTVQPVATVAIRARIDSVVKAVHFNDGQEIQAGSLLFSLDEAPGTAALQQAQANLERDRAQLDRARNDLRRSEELLRRDAVARQQYDSAVANLAALEATVRADQAAVEAATLVLSYTRIMAPMSARAGAVQVRPGTMVRANDATPLVTLTQMRPIWVAFSLPEKELPTIRAALGRASENPETKVAVRVAAPGEESAPPVEGHLVFVDSSVDPTTGTLPLKAEFTNADTRLWPGQFVEVTVVADAGQRRLAVSRNAVQMGQAGAFVWTVDKDNKAKPRPVRTGRVSGDYVAILDGLAAGDAVVIDGQSRLSSGAQVTTAEPTPQKEAPQNGEGGRRKPPSKDSPAKAPAP